MSLHIAHGLVLDVDTCNTQINLGKVKGVDFDIKFSSSLEEFNQSAASGSVDFMIIHELPNTKGLDIVQGVRDLAPGMPMIIMCEAASGTWEQSVLHPNLELVYSEAQHEDHAKINIMIWTEMVIAPSAVLVIDSSGTITERIPRSNQK